MDAGRATVPPRWAGPAVPAAVRCPAVLGLLVLASIVAVPAARASCAGLEPGSEQDQPEQVVFVGIAKGRDPERAGSAFWPHRFKLERAERGLEGVAPGEVVEVDLAVNEQVEGGMGMWVEDNLGSAPLVGARYRVGAVVVDVPRVGVRYFANGCIGGSLDRLDDPVGAEPYVQLLPSERGGSDVVDHGAPDPGDAEGDVATGLKVSGALAAVAAGVALLGRPWRSRRLPSRSASVARGGDARAGRGSSRGSRAGADEVSRPGTQPRTKPNWGPVRVDE